VIHAWEPPWADGRPCPGREALAAARTKGRILGSLEFAEAVCVWADVRAHVFMAATGAPRRTGFPVTRGNFYAPDIPWRRHRRWLGRAYEILADALHPRRPLLAQALHRLSPAQSHAQSWEQIAAANGIECAYDIPWVDCPPPSERLAAFAASVRAQGRQVLAIHALARLPTKQWPEDRWRSLLARDDVRRRFALLEIHPDSQAPCGFEGALTVATTDFPSLASALASADAVLCHDSLPAHLAAALGRPVVTIFGSGEPDWFAPWGNRDRAVHRRACPMHPCIDRCGMDRLICLDAVRVDDVAAQLDRLPRSA
jgi:ADP-heptose:LPS heptosyltransferase